MSASQNALVLTRENINVGAKSIVNLVFSTQLILSMPARQEASFYVSFKIEVYLKFLTNVF